MGISDNTVTKIIIEYIMKLNTEQSKQSLFINQIHTFVRRAQNHAPFVDVPKTYLE